MTDPMDPYDSDSDTEDWEFRNGYYLDDDPSALRRGRQALGIARNYVPGWKPAHAIREFYQNWKDAIVETAGLHQRDLCPIAKGFDEKDVYIVEARHPATDVLLGFIRFKDGVLEFTNFKSQLSRSALDIGESTKRDNEEAAGTHGEGFKIASLVMVRRGYRVQYEASEFYWTMKFAGRYENMLYCFLTEMSESKITKLKQKYQAKVDKGSHRELQNNIWEDVSVKIGKIRGIGSKIKKADFLKWIDVSLDLNRPSKIIATPYGSLIMDDAFRGRVYLKGLLLENFSTEKPFRFGYNFFTGTVNRDRERLANSEEEARVLAQIWAAAIQSNEDDTLGDYVSMLRDSSSADVHETGAHISEVTARKIWEQLLKLDHDKKIFYHDSRNGDKDVEIIRNSLKKQPDQLSTVLWDPLRRFRLVRTPQEQQYYLLHNAPLAEDKKSTYSAGMQRALRAALALDVRTKGLEIIFKCGDRTDLDLLLMDANLEINDKWLDFGLSHAHNQCWFALQLPREHSTADHFSCDHIVTDLFDLVLDELNRHPQSSEREVIESNSSLYLKVCENLRHMPIMVEANATTEVGEIEVSWADLDRDVASRVYGMDPKCRVVLHRDSTCSFRRDELLVQYPPDKNFEISPHIEDTCGCPLKIVSRRNFQALFQGLDDKETYFPMVSRAEHRAFFGLAPGSISPRSSSNGHARPYWGDATATRLPRSTSTQAENKDENAGLENDFGDLYGVSDSDEAIVVEVPSSKRPSASNSTSVQKNSASANNSLPQRPLGDRASSSPSGASQDLQVAQAEVETQKNHVRLRDQAIRELSATILKNQELLQSKEQDLELAHRDLENLKIVISELEQKNFNSSLQLEAREKQAKEKDRELREAQPRIDNATTELLSKQQQIENLQREGEDASGVIENLRNKVQQLQDTKEELEARLEEAEDAYDEQVRLASITAERRRRRTNVVKRERDGDEGNVTIKTEGSSSKRQRTIITIAQQKVVDLTGV